jgi:CDP-diacylglycerol--serine O-phosphatidyltransferase
MKIFRELGFADVFSLLNATSGFLGISYLLTRGFDTNVFNFMYFSALMDGVDGFIANKLGKKSKLGKDLDSLADLVSFGVFPASLLAIMGYIYAGVLFLLASILRLARFNVLSRYDFLGLPTVASSLLLFSTIRIEFKFVQILAIALALLMISDLEYKRIRETVPLAICGITIILCFFTVYAVWVLLILLTAYLISPGVIALARRILRQV